MGRNFSQSWLGTFEWQRFRVKMFACFLNIKGPEYLLVKERQQ